MAGPEIKGAYTFPFRSLKSGVRRLPL